MPSTSAPRIALAPSTAPSWMADAVIAGGGEIVPLADAEGLIWGAPRTPDALEEILQDADHIKWMAGYEPCRGCSCTGPLKKIRIEARIGFKGLHFIGTDDRRNPVVETGVFQ